MYCNGYSSISFQTIKASHLCHHRVQIANHPPTYVADTEEMIRVEDLQIA